jgi:hypothetical protein
VFRALRLAGDVTNTLPARVHVFLLVVSIHIARAIPQTNVKLIPARIIFVLLALAIQAPLMIIPAHLVQKTLSSSGFLECALVRLAIIKNQTPVSSAIPIARPARTGLLPLNA